MQLLYLQQRIIGKSIIQLIHNAITIFTTKKYREKYNTINSDSVGLRFSFF